MKRSEMLTKIELVLNDHFGDLTENVAEDVLSVLEEGGMKPPVRKRCPVLLTDTHVWEPENEQNSRA